MAKYKRTVIGSVVKSKNKGEPDYIKIRTGENAKNVVLKPGQTIRLESAAAQLASLKKAHAEGKLSDEIVETIEERIKKIPEWVRFELVLLEKETNND